MEAENERENGRREGECGKRMVNGKNERVKGNEWCIPEGLKRSQTGKYIREFRG
jgi:hypothetical protein